MQRFDGRAVLRGAAAALVLIVPVTIVRAVVERDVTDFSTSAWIYPLSILILGAYVAAGVTAARAARVAPLWQGALAGVAAVVAWIPIRIVVWAVREGDRGLVSGNQAALPPGQVLGALALALVLGMVGAWLAGRVRRPAPA
jgi:hypothetical protein